MRDWASQHIWLCSAGILASKPSRLSLSFHGTTFAVHIDTYIYTKSTLANQIWRVEQEVFWNAGKNWRKKANTNTHSGKHVSSSTGAGCCNAAICNLSSRMTRIWFESPNDVCLTDEIHLFCYFSFPFALNRVWPTITATATTTWTIDMGLFHRRRPWSMSAH